MLVDESSRPYKIKRQQINSTALSINEVGNAIYLLERQQLYMFIWSFVERAFEDNQQGSKSDGNHTQQSLRARQHE